MAVLAESSIEDPAQCLHARRQILVNVEINRRCPWTETCDSSCILNVLEPTAPDLSLPELRRGIEEFIDAGKRVRHFAICAKEPLATPDVLFEDVLRPYHNADSEDRPGTVGIITSGVGLSGLIDRFAALPLHWAMVSLDTFESGLRVPSSHQAVLSAALDLRSAGGTGLIGINTILTENNVNGVLRLGERLSNASVDQWALGSMLVPNSGRMVPAMNAAQLTKSIDTIVAHFTGTSTRLVFELDFDVFCDIVDDDELIAAQADRWRFEFELPGARNILFVAGNPREGHFVRLRIDGQLLAKSDFRIIGLRNGRYGRYKPGKIEGLLEAFEEPSSWAHRSGVSNRTADRDSSMLVGAV